ncbi:hypothetical protein RBSH_04379 [Rhodopirellula baltica SH28]|uniref:Uncharacterized protein n=1 Tax=Rhodopirellula baltica SH28 TaxID=993517 RepID=K5CAL8_RHOBT|nr:hypothetical protein RBSH_04379 [Rhodopirellula baltica SH28]
MESPEDPNGRTANPRDRSERPNRVPTKDRAPNVSNPSDLTDQKTKPLPQRKIFARLPALQRQPIAKTPKP